MVPQVPPLRVLENFSRSLHLILAGQMQQIDAEREETSGSFHNMLMRIQYMRLFPAYPHKVDIHQAFLAWYAHD